MKIRSNTAMARPVKTAASGAMELGRLSASKLAAFGASALAVAAIAATAFASPALAQQKDIRIGMPAPLSGALANAGTTAREGAQFAIDEINAKGGVNGRKLNLIVVDDKTDPAESTQVVRQFVEADKVDVILNAASSTGTLAHMAVTRAAGPVEVSVLATDPKVTQGDHPYMFVAAANNTQLGEGIADYAAREKGIKKFGVMKLNEAYGQNISKVFADRVKTYGASVTSEQAYAPDTKDFKPLLIAVADSKPDAIFLSGFANDSGLIVKQARELGIDLPFFGTNPLVVPQFAKIAGAAADGVVVSTLYVSAGQTRPKTVAFIKAFNAKLGHDPDVYAAHAYDIVYLIAKVFGDGAGDASSIASQLRHQVNFDGVTGTINFQENGAVKKPISIVEIKGGRPVLIR